jgi:hypothetical protein
LIPDAPPGGMIDIVNSLSARELRNSMIEMMGDHRVHFEKTRLITAWWQTRKPPSQHGDSRGAGANEFIIAYRKRIVNVFSHRQYGRRLDRGDGQDAGDGGGGVESFVVALDAGSALP